MLAGRRRVERLTRLFPCQFLGGEAAQLVVDQREELLGGVHEDKDTGRRRGSQRPVWPTPGGLVNGRRRH